VNVAQQMERQLADEKASARRALHAVAETLLTLAQAGCAIRGHEYDEGRPRARAEEGRVEGKWGWEEAGKGRWKVVGRSLID